MKWFSLIVVCCVCVLSGCGTKVAENVDPDRAKQALQSALDAWKEGKPRAGLESLQPSIVMNESDWSADSRLLDYKMDDAGRPEGRQVKWTVQIKFQDKSGKVSERKATYIIDTTPRIVIVRDSFGL